MEVRDTRGGVDRPTWFKTGRSDRQTTKSRRGDDEVRRQTMKSIESDMMDSMNDMVQNWTVLVIGKSHYHGRKMQVARLGSMCRARNRLPACDSAGCEARRIS